MDHFTALCKVSVEKGGREGLKEVHQKFTLTGERRTHTGRTSLLHTFQSKTHIVSLLHLSFTFTPSPVLSHPLLLTLVLSFPLLFSHLSPILPSRYFLAFAAVRYCCGGNFMPANGQICGSLPNIQLLSEHAVLHALKNLLCDQQL